MATDARVPTVGAELVVLQRPPARVVVVQAEVVMRAAGRGWVVGHVTLN